MKKTIRDFELNGKRVIIRCDFNVPIMNHKIIDDTRIKESLPTIKYALENHAKIILLSHLGRIKTINDKDQGDLKIVATHLEQLLAKKVIFINATRGPLVNQKIKEMRDGDIVLLQNTRYEDIDGNKESGCDLDLAKYWASLGDIFINDAFGTLHRAHASNFGISKYLPSGIGFLVEKEITILSSLFVPDKPFMIILGGSKVADKVNLIAKLLPNCDNLLIGGGMAFTFLKTTNYPTGKSLIDENNLSFCANLLKEYPSKIILPLDVLASSDYTNSKPIEKHITELSDEYMGLDIGKETINLFEQKLKDAKTVFWNGPLGVCEFSNYQQGTLAILDYLTKNNIKTIIGGGDTGAIASKYKDKLYHISTGGGASLQFLEGKEMPGLKNIDDK